MTSTFFSSSSSADIESEVVVVVAAVRGRLVADGDATGLLLRFIPLESCYFTFAIRSAAVIIAFVADDDVDNDDNY